MSVQSWNTQILVIAVLMKAVMQRTFNVFQWEALVLLVAGITVNQLNYCTCAPGGPAGVYRRFEASGLNGGVAAYVVFDQLHYCAFGAGCLHSFCGELCRVPFELSTGKHCHR